MFIIVENNEENAPRISEFDFQPMLHGHAFFR